MLPDFLKRILSRKQKPKEITLPDNLFVGCPECHTTVYRRKLDRNADVCPECGHHFVIGTARWVEILADRRSFHELWPTLKPEDPLSFPKYGERARQLMRSERSEALLAGECTVEGLPLLLGVMNPEFLMASLGSVAGEKITRLFELGTDRSQPVLLVIRSGGARMQEGVFSLMQMAKTSAAVRRHSDAGNLFIALLTHPTTGGVSASYAMLGDIIIGEPGALIGFAGPRVIEQTIKQQLPEGFQRSEFLLQKGFLDAVVPRTEIHGTLAQLLRLHQREAHKDTPWPGKIF